VAGEFRYACWHAGSPNAQVVGSGVEVGGAVDEQAASRKGGKFMGMDVLFFTTIGSRTGERRETPVAWFPDGESAWLIVASAGGSAHNPAWYHNLAAHPDQVWIELPQRQLRVLPEQLEGADREERWKRIVQAQPRYAKYQEKTDRHLPVIRLVPAST
jgi:deazaflavin-dependent oxidoreductase (nitroreductase family)